MPDIISKMAGCIFPMNKDWNLKFDLFEMS